MTIGYFPTAGAPADRPILPAQSRGPTLSPFTPDAIDPLPGPAWLTDRRSRAAQHLGMLTLPTTEEEVWRYSRIDELDLDDFAAPTTEVAAPGSSPRLPTGVRAVLDGMSVRAGTVVIHNGFVTHVDLDPGWTQRGVRLGRLEDFDEGQGLLGSVASEPIDYFAAMNDALCADPVGLFVPAGVVVDLPIVVVDWVDAAGVVVAPRLVVRCEDNSEVQLVDWHGSDEVVSLAVPVIELDAGPASRLHYVNVQDRAQTIWQIASQVSQAGTDATVTAAQAALGGDYARTRADCRLVGRGASGNLRAVYFGEQSQMLDFRTFQDHVAPDTTSNLLFKGAVGDTSRSVYTGLIKVRKQARGTNAFQTNRNIKLSDHAWAESVPNLEIENNDVRCSHASTVGPVDEDQRFYLESRGVPTAVAERLIVAGFFTEVLEQFPAGGVTALVRTRIEARLDRRVHEAAAQEQEGGS